MLIQMIIKITVLYALKCRNLLLDNLLRVSRYKNATKLWQNFISVTNPTGQEISEGRY